MFLQATALGLAMHQMGGFDAAQVHARFGVPAEFEVLAIIALGYPGDLPCSNNNASSRNCSSYASVGLRIHSLGTVATLRAVPGGAR